ncbi:MAG: TetR/AcrR family transcriptional regulator [Bacteroidota bacterium]
MERSPELHSRKQQIIQTAAKLFRKNGFKGTSLKSIAEEMGIKTPSLYNHIASKNEILSHLLLTNANTFHLRMEEIQKANIDSLQKLDRIISLHIELTLQNPDAMGLMLNDWVHLDPKDREEYLELREKYEQNFLSILQQCIDKGQLVPMNTNLMLFIILSTLRSLYAWCTRYRDFNRIELENSVKTGLLEGLLNKY